MHAHDSPHTHAIYCNNGYLSRGTRTLLLRLSLMQNDSVEYSGVPKEPKPFLFLPLLSQTHTFTILLLLLLSIGCTRRMWPKWQRVNISIHSNAHLTIPINHVCTEANARTTQTHTHTHTHFKCINRCDTLNVEQMWTIEWTTVGWMDDCMAELNG